MRRLLFAGGLLCAPTICLAIQPGDGGFCLRGHISDETGASAADVTVSVRLVASDGARPAVSNSSGQFEVCGLGAGKYRIDAHKPAFTDQVSYGTLGTDDVPPIEIAITRENSPITAEKAEIGAESIEGFMEHPDTVSLRDIDDPVFTRRNVAHGQADLTWGLRLHAEPNAMFSYPLPVSYRDASVGGGAGKNSYFAGLERFEIDPQRMLAKLAINELKTGNTQLPNTANTLTANAIVLRADRQFSDRDSAYARFRRDELSVRRTRLDQGDKVSSSGQVLKMTNQEVSAANTVELSPSTVSETSAQLVVNEGRLPGGAAALGVQSEMPTERRNRVFEAATNVYRQTGGQSLRVGADFMANQMNIAFLESGEGRAKAGNPSLSQSDRYSGLYVVSEHRLRPNLEATTGIRYDLQALQGFKRDANNLAPQAGLAWAVTAKTVIRGGVGVYYDQIPLPALAGSSSPEASANIEDSARFVSRNGHPAGDLANFVTLVPSIQNSYAEQANVQVDQQLGAKSVLSAQTEYVRGVQLALPVLKSANLCASAGACNSGNTFAGQEMGSGAVSSYTGLSIALAQQPVRWGSYKASYTYSQASGEGNAENTSQIADSMRRASFTGSLHSSAGPASDFWQQFSNGFALSETVDYTTKSEFAGLSFINIDARLTKTLAWGRNFRLEAMAETFNMLQRTSAAYARSVAEMGPGASSVFATYQKVASMQIPSGSQMGLRMVF